MIRFFICCLVILTVSRGYSDDAALNTAPNTEQASIDTNFVEMFLANTDNLWRLGDSVPHIRRLLSAPQLRRVLMEGKLGQSLPAMDPEKGLQAIEQFAINIPDEIVVGTSSESLDQFGRLLKTTLLLSLSAGAVEVDASKSPDLIRQSVRELEQIELPRVVAWVRFRDPNIAQGLFNLSSGMVSNFIRQNTDLEIISERDMFGFRGTIGTFIPAETIPDLMLQFGLALDRSDVVQQAARLIADLRIQVWFEHSASGMRITIGDRIAPTAPKLTTRQLSSLWQPIQSRFIYGQWNTKSAIKQLESTEALWKKWEETPTGRALQANDVEDLLGDLSLAVRQFQQTGPVGNMRIDVTDSIDGLSVSRGGKAAVPLNDLLKLVPQSAEIVTLSGTDSIGDHLSGILSNFEERLAKNSLKYELQEKDLQAQMTNNFSEFYYSKLADFRELIHDSSVKTFTPPYAMLIDTEGEIAKLDIRVKPGASDANRITVQNMPMLEYAVIGKATNPEQALQLSGQIWSAIISSFGKAPTQSTRQADLGLGRPTYVFDSSFLDNIPELDISLDGPMRPHYFQLDDGWFVFSTSDRLSKTIVDAAAGKTPTLKLDDAQNLVGYGVVPGETVERYFDDLGVLFADFLSGGGERVTISGPLSQMHPQGAQLGGMIQGFGEVAGLMDEVRWRTVDSTQQRTTKFSVTFTE